MMAALLLRKKEKRGRMSIQGAMMRKLIEMVLVIKIEGFPREIILQLPSRSFVENIAFQTFFRKLIF
jgi:hypothetical protein